MDVRTFVVGHLPAVPARVLEVGCGRGDLARAIARRGYDVVAIDPDAPEGDLFLAVSLEEFGGRGPFDAVVASRALHHIADLAGALDKIAALLRPGGRLLLYEHAWDRLDEPTARWYLNHRKASGHGETLDRCRTDWRSDHAGLHGYATMRDELDRRFSERAFAWMPYLYSELGDAATEQQEQCLIAAGSIQATGFGYVGERPV